MTPRWFFLVGAFKSGTTALASYLREHPSIAMAEPKEPYFFADDFRRIRRARTLEDYLSLFPNRPAATCRGEATAGYLYSQSALPALARFAPEARLVVLLRRPDELVHAFHSELLYARDERVGFERAWRLESARRRGEEIPKTCRTPEFLRYREVGKLGSQLRRLFEIFPRHQVHVALFDELRRDPGGVYRSVLRFLELPDDGRQKFAVVNPHRRHRLGFVGDWSQRPPRRLVAASQWLKGVARVERWRWLDRVRRWNAPPTRRAPLAPALAREVLEEFLPEVRLLESLLDRDLSAWKVPAK